MSFWRIVLVMLAGGCLGGSLSLGGCATQHDTDSTVRLAVVAGLQASYATADGFELLVVRGANSQVVGAGKTLRVYIAGDGTPWRGNRITKNPGPRQPLAIELMLRDSAPAVYLGRPCYHRQTRSCRPSLWSFERFSQRVVDTMAVALRQLSSEAGNARLMLVGYSGGGVLATLLAREVEAVDAVVTLAAPLDVSTWAAYHGYTPLLGSLNPARLPTPTRAVAELHLQGVNDEEVPPATTEGYFDNQEPSGRVVRRQLEAHDHRCCWLSQWPGLLSVLNNPEHW